MSYKLPSAIKSGHRIHIVAPASKIQPERFAQGCDVLARRGFKLVVHDQVYAVQNQSAGRVEQKAEALRDTMRSDEAPVIWAACGGNRTAHVLPLVAGELAKSQGIILGFSDVTALQAAAYRLNQRASFFAPTVQRLATLNPADLDYLFGLLAGQTRDYPLEDAVVLREGKAQAPIYAATLSILAALAGTEFMPDLCGHILALEDTNEELSRVDRMLWQLQQVIPLSSLAGIMLGSFDPIPESGSAFGFTLADLVLEHAGDANIPIIMNGPFGHGSRMQALANGATAVLHAEQSGANLTYINPVVQIQT